MKSDKEVEKPWCDYCNCKEDGVVYDEELSVYLCEKHSNMVVNNTGFCSSSCQLGYGCDGSC